MVLPKAGHQNADVQDDRSPWDKARMNFKNHGSCCINTEKRMFGRIHQLSG